MMDRKSVNKEVFQVSRWIYQDFIGNLSDKNREALEAWRKAHPDNECTYQALHDRLRLSKNLSQLKVSDIERPLADMYRRIRAEEQRQRFRQFWQWMSAAAMVAICIGSFYLVWEWKHSAVVVPETPTVAVGEGRVVLRLGDGSLVGLDTLTGSVRQGCVEASKTDKRRLSYAIGNQEKGKEDVLVYNEVIVPKSGSFSLVLADGTSVWVNAESRLRYPVAFAGGERKVYLEGEAYFAVAKDTLHPFVVETGKMDVAVLGTQFNVSTYRVDGCCETTLVEGSVEVRDRLTDKRVMLSPNEQARLRDGNFVVREVDARLYTSWISGKFYFEREPLEEIAAQMERWYDVSFFFMREDLKQEEFTGVILRDYTLEEMLGVIAKTTDMEFTVNGKAVTLR